MLQRAVDNLYTWSEMNGLPISTEKTKGILFTRKKRYNKPQLTLNGKSIPFVNHHVFLGVTLDYRLNWHAHLRETKMKALKNFAPLKALKNKRFGPAPHRLLNIYRTLVRTVFDYGCTAYATATPTALKIIETTQNAGIRTALRALPTSPIIAIQLLSEEPPLTYRRAFLTLKYCHKVSKTRDHVNYNMFFTNQNTLLNEYVRKWMQVANIDTAMLAKPPAVKKQLFECWRRTLANKTTHPLTQAKENTTKWTTNIYEKCSKDLSTTTAMIRIYTGHTLLTHKYIFSSSQPPTCEVCNGNPKLTITHVIFECSKYTKERRRHITGVNPTELYELKNIVKIKNFIIDANLINLL